MERNSRKKWVSLAVCFGFLAASLIYGSGCRSKIPGEVDAPPPKGGPKSSDRHPPGLTDQQLKSGAYK